MHLPALILDLAIILGVAAIVTFIFRLIKQPVVLGYIVAGLIVGPYTPAFFSINDVESVKVWAELGVIFLMFALGLEFSFRRLAKVGMSATVVGIIQIVTMIFLGIVVANALGWSKMDAVFLGCMISVSSTTIIIKALDELQLKGKKFSELVFGVLIVEDLAAILMMVGLTNIATTSEIGGIGILVAGAKLAIVVGAWFLVGMFLVPRFIKSVGRHGNDEMLTVVATALCLALVAFGAYFQYSVALGAFIMGSILAESSEAKRIEHLVQPLKDIFAAVFFVSVGMLLNPQTIIDNVGTVAILSLIIIFGKLLSVTIGALTMGNTVKNSVQTGFSMAQIGEFSFIIASLGVVYGAINDKIYPIIVAASLVTTFTTPYLIKFSPGVADTIEGWLPVKVKITLNNYATWMQRRSAGSENQKVFYKKIIKWSLNAVVVITLFTVAADKLVPFFEKYIVHAYPARGVAWLVAFTLSAPSIWAMLSAFRDSSAIHRRAFPKGGALFMGRILAVALLGLLSVAYFPAIITLVLTISAFGILFVIFRGQIESYYYWIEQQFKSGFQADLDLQEGRGKAYRRLAPWDAHLVEMNVPSRSFLVGKSLVELKLREKYGLNVVVIVRDGENIVAPKATEPLYPGDRILFFATDAEIELLKADIDEHKDGQEYRKDIEAYDIMRLKILEASPFEGVSIRKSEIREKYECIVVGVERGGRRITSPASDMSMKASDILWIVGERKQLQNLKEACSCG